MDFSVKYNKILLTFKYITYNTNVRVYVYVNVYLCSLRERLDGSLFIGTSTHTYIMHTQSKMSHAWESELKKRKRDMPIK